MPIVIGGIEASLRRIAHFDYWSEKVRRSVLLDAKADLLVYGNAERQIVEIAHRLAAGAKIDEITDLRGTSFVRKSHDFIEIDSTQIDTPGQAEPAHRPVCHGAAKIRKAQRDRPTAGARRARPRPTNRGIEVVVKFARRVKSEDRERSVIRMPSFEQVTSDPVLYAHANRVLHLETNPGNARALVQRHGDLDVWLNPPPIPLTTTEMDYVFELPYARVPHPAYGKAEIPACEMIKFSVTIMRGCFGGCTFCSITEHEGRIIQSRSEDSRAQARSRRSATRCPASPASSPTSAAPPPTCTASPARAARSRRPAASRAACSPASARTSTPTTRR